MSNIVTQRFLECFERLRLKNKVRSGRQFAIALDYLPQSFSEIQKGRRDVTIELLRKAVDVFEFNPDYVLRGEGGYFLGEVLHESSRVLTIVTDNDNDERIIHVPVKAQAGYAAEALDQIFIHELPKYTLPDYTFKVGTHRSFDVAGDSMEPTLKDGDTIICSYVEHLQWESSIRNNHVYVIITKGDVLVKRVNNHLRRHRHLELISDNDFYPIQRVNVSDIQEVWLVRSVLSVFSHIPPDPKPTPREASNSHDIPHVMIEQSQRIRNLESMLERLLEKGHMA